MDGLDPERRERRSRREGLASGMRGFFFVLGSLLNLLALIILVGNIAQLLRLWLTGGALALGSEQLAPLGAFLAGLICYLIAFTLD